MSETIYDGTPISFITQGIRTDIIRIGTKIKAFIERRLTPNVIKYIPAASEDKNMCAE